MQGAIFDCDGTLLDSMPMWTQSCVGLLERYGVDDALRVFLEHESLDMDKKCAWYHENLGIGQSSEQLYRELWDCVAHAYKTTVRPFPGCEAFLESLARRGVPMAIASSTPPELLEVALSAHGLLGYFGEVVFAGDVGRSKEYPDVYLAACQRLGTSVGETWVFEDAPFGVRSAARAGFPTVAIANDHDDRDPAFLRRWATVVSHGYEGLDPKALDALGPGTLRALVVAGSPQMASPALVANLAAEAGLVVAADSGAAALMAAGVSPDILCGDEDSAGEEALRWAHKVASRVERFPREKDDTDLGLAVNCAREEARARGTGLHLVVTSASGGRPDHMLGVWGVLARNASLAPALVEDEFTCRVLSAEGSDSWQLEGQAGATFSVVALRPDAVVSLEGMQWNLDHAPLELVSERGVSNCLLEERARITCHSGVVAAFVLATPDVCQTGGLRPDFWP
ncbi:MAG: thiamine diphosphokinase [Coriobacteriales bacterium]|nr:thiamine diphosphokinase [Coriobacteriales bacterium]